MRFGFILCLGVTIGACGASTPTPAPTPPSQTGSRQAPERPRATSHSPSHSPSGADPILAELKRLNRWCSGQDDCDVVERPKAYPGRVAHGETRGFINSSKARLHKLGAQVVWDPAKNRYRLTTSTGPAPPTASVVRTRTDLLRHHGKPVDLLGRYRAVAMPSKGGTRPGQIGHPGQPKEYAFIQLADKTVVYLERYNTPLARRPAAERRSYNGQRVLVRGTLHRICPSTGQSHQLPCLTAIKQISIVKR